ncbi:MAG: ABC transporter permease, partial [Alphaproteobacteria bacterium]
MTIATDLATAPNATRTERAQPESPGRRAALLAGLDVGRSRLDLVGLGFLVPLARLLLGDASRATIRELTTALGVPLIGIVCFLGLWAALAPQVNTSLGAVPGPAQVWEQATNLYDEHRAERKRRDAFYERQAARNAQLVADGQTDRVRERTYTGRPTYVDQILTSLGTVALGFGIATLIAVPLGVV